MEELQKSSFQYTIKKKLNERKVILSQLREELAQFDEIAKYWKKEMRSKT